MIKYKGGCYSECFDEDNYYVPDEIIVCDPNIIEDDSIHGTPDLIVEILLKSTTIKDRMDKFVNYEKLERNAIFQYYTDEEYDDIFENIK